MFLLNTYLYTSTVILTFLFLIWNTKSGLNLVIKIVLLMASVAGIVQSLAAAGIVLVR